MKPGETMAKNKSTSTGGGGVTAFVKSSDRDLAGLRRRINKEAVILPPDASYTDEKKSGSKGGGQVTPYVTISERDFAGLRSRIGENAVILPADDSYLDARQGFNKAHQSYPRAIVKCSVVADVAECLAFARKHSLKVAVRSGGHSTAGYSVNGGLVIDLAGLDSTSVQRDAEGHAQITVGAGIKFTRLNEVLENEQLHVPGAGCETVGVGGYMQGGGYGLTSLYYGMNCDNVTSLKLMDASGNVVTASSHENADLFFAVRGGTGNNFGVLLEVTYDTHPMTKLLGWRLDWELTKEAGSVRRVAEALHDLQTGFMAQRKEDLPKDFGYEATIGRDRKGRCALRVTGVCDTSPAELRAFLKPLKTRPKLLGRHPYRHFNEGFDDDPPLPPDGSRYDGISGYVDKPLDVGAWAEILTQFNETLFPDWDTMVIEPYGGAIRAPRSPNAFDHRDVSMNFYLMNFWFEEADRGAVKARLDQFDGFLRSRGYVNGFVYQNYPRRGRPTSRSRYWQPATLRKLSAVKDKYDPDGLFDFEQGVDHFGRAKRR
jgi:FAD/FMN-containing dehydrogenase